MYKYDHIIKKIKEIDPSFPINKNFKKKILKFKKSENSGQLNKDKLDKAV